MGNNRKRNGSKKNGRAVVSFQRRSNFMLVHKGAPDLKNLQVGSCYKVLVESPIADRGAGNGGIQFKKFFAILRVIDSDGRTEIETEDGIKYSREEFYSTFPMAKFRDWFLISGIPVQISRHTSKFICMTKIVCDSIARVHIE